ncbi:thiol:disulfide interchange protein DsbA/DsbL [Aliidiomarina celeris]|uniref:thiol:disulfide interchange protein DsbA/DsbL n=1 Tax=Aliidiomarina celeris TaxID=2249428 RepID=UPI000DE86771|nr:thiol:disulfide interchange protein DsbA/DsbL [Aliidiomarina celeris]
MKKYVLALVAAVSFFSVQSQAMDFREGVHYEVISETATESPEIIDFFSFYCNACYQFRPFSQMLENEFGDTYKAYQVDFIAPRDMSEVIVRAWAVAQILGVEKEVKDRIFHQHFVRRQNSNSLNDLKAIFEQAGIEAARFDQAYGSFPARSLSNRMRSAASQFNVRGTPTYIVNGKYRMLQQGFRDSGNQFFEHYFELAKYLLNKDA